MTTIPTWIQQAREKIASSQTKDDQAIAKAFAQQAYTAVGNRDRAIMKDPFLLGFEIVDKNEDNNRLVGVFAFRVSGEILMVPVFYLNGQIKGQDLIYRKPVNRFYPNTEKWVNYFVGRGQDETGRPVARRSNADARIHMGINRMTRMPGGYKQGSAGAPQSNPTPFQEWLDPRTALPHLYSQDENGAATVIPTGNTLPPPAPQPGKDFFPESKTLGDAIGGGSPQGFSDFLNAADTKEAAEKIDIQAEWKEACDKTGFRPEHLDQFMFADFLVDHGLQKAAATLANRVPWFADTIVLGGLLDKPLTKKASAPKRSLEYHVDPPAGATEAEVAAHYTRGFSFVDKRAAESLATAIESSPISRTWSSLRKPGINRVAGKDGSFQKVLWAPTTSGSAILSDYRDTRHKSNPEHRLVFLEGPDKGCVITYRHGCAETELPLFTDDAEANKENKGGTAADKEVPGDSTPQKGKTYVVWLPELGMLFGEPFHVKSVESTGDVTKINFDKGSAYGETQCRVILRKDLEATTAADFQGNSTTGMPRVIGSDAVWIPIEAQLNYEHGMPETAANVSYATFQPPASFRPVTLSTIDEALSNSKQASITIERNTRSGLFSLRGPDGKLRLEDLPARHLAIKLARDMRLPAAEAIEIVDLAKAREKVAFTWLAPGYEAAFSKTFTDIPTKDTEKEAGVLSSLWNEKIKPAVSGLWDSGKSMVEELSAPGGILDEAGKSFTEPAHIFEDKSASAYYDRDIDPRAQFQNYDWDEDMDIPIENAYQFQDYAEARRERYTRPAQNYLDVHDPGQGRNQRYADIDHIPDDVILRMVHPMQEMAQLGQQMGLETLMDHGAVGSLVKVFDVKPYMHEYISKLENSLDHLGRLVFMLYWKPKDFSELFGQDDIPQIENKLTGVFSSYGDLILELLQSSGDK